MGDEDTGDASSGKVVVFPKKKKSSGEIPQVDDPCQLSLLGLEVLKTPPTIDEIAWSPVFCFQTCLPHSPVKTEHLDANGNWVRRNGNIELRISSSIGPHGMPFGKYPRLFLMWLTDVINSQYGDISETGLLRWEGSYRSFCREIGVDFSLGERGPARLLVDQIFRVVNCRFEMRYVATEKRAGKLENALQTRNFFISSGMDLRWDAQNSKPRDWMESARGGFAISRDFLAEIRAHKMPVDRRIMRAVSSGRSPFRIDLYHWLAYRNHALIKQGRQSAHVRWEDLRGQFGGVHKELFNFVSSFRSELLEIRKVWPDLVFNASRPDTFVLTRSRSPVPPALGVSPSLTR